MKKGQSDPSVCNFQGLVFLQPYSWLFSLGKKFVILETHVITWQSTGGKGWRKQFLALNYSLSVWIKLSCCWHLKMCIWIRVSHTNAIHSINSHSLNKCPKIWKLKPENTVYAGSSMTPFRLAQKGTKWTIWVQMISSWVVIVPECSLYCHTPTNLGPFSPLSIHSSCNIVLYYWLHIIFKWFPIWSQYT